MPAQASLVADAVLVLGGALGAPRPPAQPHLGFGAAADRVWHAAALYRAGKARWVVLSGGSPPGSENVAPEAEAMAEVLRALGVPASAMRLEGRSRNTLENAVLSLALVRQVGARRVLLVTSALHMPRALAVFQAVAQLACRSLFAHHTVERLAGLHLGGLRRQWRDGRARSHRRRGTGRRARAAHGLAPGCPVAGVEQPQRQGVPGAGAGVDGNELTARKKNGLCRIMDTNGNIRRAPGG